MGKSAKDATVLTLTRVESEDGDDQVVVIRDDDIFFTAHGDNLDMEGLKFYASLTKAGKSIGSVKIDFDGKPQTRRARLVAKATQVDKGCLDTPLWLVGFVDLQTHASLEDALIIPS